MTGHLFLILTFLVQLTPACPFLSQSDAAAPQRPDQDNGQRIIEATRIIRVGPQQRLRRISDAAAVARDGDVIEIDPGDYVADAAVWRQQRLTIRGVGDRPRIIASGANAEGKAIWVVRGGEIIIENLEFTGARVPDKNGAGIRFEQGSLVVRRCRFVDNENGILSSAGSAMQLDVENCEFEHNGAGDGLSHNLYIGGIQRLRVTGSYFHHARSGHLLKSRAAENHILYNRLTDETGGQASYELEFPNGGIAYVIGNIIQQSPTTSNSGIISFGAEGYPTASNELYLINNTIADDRPSPGNPLFVKAGVQRLIAMNNLLITSASLNPSAVGQLSNNFNTDPSQFAMPTRYDYRLRSDSKLIGRYTTPPFANGLTLAPQREYFHPTSTKELAVLPRSPGALQPIKVNDLGSLPQPSRDKITQDLRWVWR